MLAGLLLLGGPDLRADTGEDCAHPFDLRGIRPTGGSMEVPTGVQPLVALIGTGSLDDVRARLVTSSDGEAVSTEQDEACYAHEGDDEQHCTLTLRPVEDLAPDTAYRVVVDLPGGSKMNSDFSTAADWTSPELPAPEVTLSSWGPRSEDTVEPCDWDLAVQVDLEWSLDDFEGRTQSVLQVVETLDGADEGELVHTLFVSEEPGQAFRQVLAPGDLRARCYEVWVQDQEGRASASAEAVCVDPSEAPDTGGEPDTGDDSGEVGDTGPGGEDSSGDLDSGDDKDSGSDGVVDAPPEPQAGGCGGRAVLLWGPLLMLGLVRRRAR